MALPPDPTTVLPAPLAALLADITAELEGSCPADAARIHAAATLVHRGAVELPPTGTHALVYSSHCPDVAYTATRWQCSCPDAQLRERRCKHQYAVTLLGALEDEIRYQARSADIAFTLTEKGQALLAGRPLWRRLERARTTARTAAPHEEA